MCMRPPFGRRRPPAPVASLPVEAEADSNPKRLIAHIQICSAGRLCTGCLNENKELASGFTACALGARVHPCRSLCAGNELLEFVGSPSLADLTRRTVWAHVVAPGQQEGAFDLPAECVPTPRPSPPRVRAAHCPPSPVPLASTGPYLCAQLQVPLAVGARRRPDRCHQRTQVRYISRIYIPQNTHRTHSSTRVVNTMRKYFDTVFSARLLAVDL